VDANGDYQPVKVKVGLSSNEYAEITEGLKEGQLVRMSVADDMKAKLPETKGKTLEQIERELLG
jgi:multidrug efflux pump subunit AcrA (membrane-fusion protein)